MKNTAPLQKRLAAVSQQKGTTRIKVEAGLNIKQEGEKKSTSSKGEQSKVGQKSNSSRGGGGDADKTAKEPFKMNLPKNAIKLTLKTATGRPANQTVLDKLGTNKEDLDSEKRKRKLEDPNSAESVKQRKLENQELMETLKQRLKTNLEAKQAAKEKKLAEVMANEKKATEKDKKKKAGAGAGSSSSTTEGKARRKEELLKQLKAVEEAIHRKRTKLEK